MKLFFLLNMEAKYLYVINAIWHNVINTSIRPILLLRSLLFESVFFSLQPRGPIVAQRWSHRPGTQVIGSIDLNTGSINIVFCRVHFASFITVEVFSFY